jgi:hypothetical protein
MGNAIDALEQCFSNRVSRHICVSQVFSNVSPNYFEISFYGKILQNFQVNIKFILFCFKNVSPKNNFMENVSPTKKGWESLHKKVLTVILGYKNSSGSAIFVLYNRVNLCTKITVGLWTQFHWKTDVIFRAINQEGATYNPRAISGPRRSIL